MDYLSYNISKNLNRIRTSRGWSLDDAAEQELLANSGQNGKHRRQIERRGQLRSHFERREARQGHKRRHENRQQGNSNP